MRRDSRFYFGRLNLIPTQEAERKRGLLLEGLRYNTTLEYRGVIWGFYQVNEITAGDELFIHGFLVKYRPQALEEIAVPETRQLDEQAINNLVSAKSRFFLHISSGLIAYHAVGRDIRRDTFRDRFARLLEKALGNFFVAAEIQSIEQQYTIFEALSDFERINRVSIYLHPANPDLTDATRNIQNRLKQLRTDTYIERYESRGSEAGLEVLHDQEIRSKISMAEDGYGKAEVTGTMEGEIITITTADSPLTAFTEGDVSPPEVVLEELSGPIRKIFQRFGKTLSLRGERSRESDDER